MLRWLLLTHARAEPADEGALRPQLTSVEAVPAAPAAASMKRGRLAPGRVGSVSWRRRVGGPAPPCAAEGDAPCRAERAGLRHQQQEERRREEHDVHLHPEGEAKEHAAGGPAPVEEEQHGARLRPVRTR